MAINKLKSTGNENLRLQQFFELPKSGIRCGNDGQYKVRDNGIGIKHSDLDKIFDLFTRSDDVDDYEVPGVGLAIVKKIMQKHKGAFG